MNLQPHPPAHPRDIVPIPIPIVSTTDEFAVNTVLALLRLIYGPRSCAVRSRFMIKLTGIQ